MSILRNSLLIASLVFVAGRAVAAEPVSVGLFVPLTGSVSANGINIRNGVELYVDQFNRAGGADGRTIKLLIEDDRNSPKDAAVVAQRIASDPNVVLAIGSFTSTPSLAAAPVLAEAKIPQIAPTAAHPDYTKRSNFQFRQDNLEQLYADVDAEIALDRLKAKKIAVVYHQDDWGVVAQGLLKAAIEKRGGTVVLSEPLIPGSRDFRPLVSKIKSAEPDAIFAITHYTETAVFVQQLRQAAVKLPIGASRTLTNPKFVELAGRDADGIVLQTLFDPGDPAHKTFTDAYKARYGVLPDRLAALAYDSAAVGLNAIKRVLAAKRPLTGQSVRDAIADAPPYRGVTGVTEYKDGEVNKKSVILVIRNGQYVPID